MRISTLHQRLRAKNRNQAMVIGVTWYNEATWAEVKATATDPQCFEQTFEKWKAVAVKARREFQRSGVRAIECHIVPQELFAWCELHGQDNNSTSRAEFVSAKLTAEYEGKA
ncbi:MAG: hypothetical protein PHP57_11190 [Sideroxydans sp.]|nr:hypothetical protein [Sideroxydans sp.]